MERQENDENIADIKVKIELESDVEDRMPSYSGNKTAKLSYVCSKEEIPITYYIEANNPYYNEEEAVPFIKPEQSDPVKSDSEDQEEDIEMKEVKVMLTNFDKFTCVLCDRHLDRNVPMGAFKHYDDIVLFCKDCIKPKAKIFICVKCNYRSSKRSALIMHFDAVHRKLKRYKCEECDGAFTQAASLKRHVQSAHRKLKHTCQQCKKVFSSRDYLYKHVNFTHRQLNIFTCDLCNKTFPDQSHFKQHIDGVHKKIKEFECEECKSVFFIRSNLTRHLNAVHWKLKPLACDKCNRCFASRGELKKHINSVHLKINYICVECNKYFTAKGNLRVHINVIHRKIKPFVCEICNHAFGSTSDLKKHVTSAKCQLQNSKQSKSILVPNVTMPSH